MAQDSWPSLAHAAGAITEAEWEKLASRFSENGVDGTPLDAAVVSAGAGLEVSVRSGVYASVRGFAWYSGGVADTLVIAANASGSTRIDRVVLRLDRSTWDVRAVIRAGTPGSGAPALTQQTGTTGLYEVLLADVTVPNGAASVTVVDRPQFIGTRIRVADDSKAPPDPQLGEVHFRPNTGQWRGWNGSAWVTIFDNSGQVVVDSALAVWSIDVTSVLERRSGSVHLRLGAWERTATTLPGATDSPLPVLIPSAYRHPNRNQYGTVYITGARAGRVTVYAANVADRAGQVWLTQHPDIATGNVVQASNISWVVN